MLDVINEAKDILSKYVFKHYPIGVGFDESSSLVEKNNLRT